MATRRVKSSAVGLADGSTWADAYTTIAAALTASASGDVVWVSSAHSENPAANQTWAFGAATSGTKSVYCVTESGAADQSGVTTGAVAATNGAFSITLTGAGYVYGVELRPGTSTNAADIIWSTTTALVMEDCILYLGGSNAGSDFAMTDNLGGAVRLVDCQIRVSNAGSTLDVSTNALEIIGGSVVSGSTSPTTFITPAASRGVSVLVSGFDFSNFGAGVDLCAAVATVGDIRFRNCRLPDSWTGTLLSAAIAAPGFRASLHNTDDTDTNYRIIEQSFYGDTLSDTAVYNDAGADDGSAQGFAWKMVSTANTRFPRNTLVSPEIVRWNSTTGSAITVTVEIVHNSQGTGTAGALTNAEAWLEVEYLSSTTRPLTATITDRVDGDNGGNLLATAADQASSSAAWTGDSAGWDTQKLSVTFTPQCVGFIHARVHLAKASATVYVDPLLTVT